MRLNSLILSPTCQSALSCQDTSSNRGKFVKLFQHVINDNNDKGQKRYSNKELTERRLIFPVKMSIVSSNK